MVRQYPIGTAATEVMMEPDNRPYVDPHTEPGDAGTEKWADAPRGTDDSVGRQPGPEPLGTADDRGVVEGSPADSFINDPEAISARNDEADG
jgi:hypothetical protein